MESQKQAPSALNLRTILIIGVVVAGGYVFLGGPLPFIGHKHVEEKAAEAPAESGPPTLDLTKKQLEAVKVGKAAAHDFFYVKKAVGSVDFNQDNSTQVSSPYQGRIVKVFVSLGDRVTQGQPLFTLESPDYMTAQSALLAGDASRTLTRNNFARLQKARAVGGASEKDLDQARNDEQAAEGVYASARLALSVFGKSEEEIEALVKSRKFDGALVVHSPVAGVVSARSAAPGFLVQPGNTPVPVVVSDDSQMWLNAYVMESDALALNVGQDIVATIPTASKTPFKGKLTQVGSVVDPATHRILARAEVADPEHKLRAGMVASFAITVDKPTKAVAIPTTGVVREGDGSMTVWVQKDATHYTQRLVKLGALQDGYVEILEGLQDGDAVIVDGAVFVDNILNAGPSD